MLADYAPIPTLAVSDLVRARAFYEGVLELASKGDVPEGVLYAAGQGAFLVYPSSFAGTNKATAMAFQVPSDAFDAEVAALRARGVAFVTFDLPTGSWQDGVASFDDGSRAVWFADPDGNFISLETIAAG